MLKITEQKIRIGEFFIPIYIPAKIKSHISIMSKIICFFIFFTDICSPLNLKTQNSKPVESSFCSIIIPYRNIIVNIRALYAGANTSKVHAIKTPHTSGKRGMRCFGYLFFSFRFHFFIFGMPY